MKTLLQYWLAVEGVCDYLRKHHGRDNPIGYNISHPLSVAIWEMWVYRWNHPDYDN